MTDIVFVTPTTSLTLSKETNGTLLLATKLLQSGFDVKVVRFCQMEHYQKDYPKFIQEIVDTILAMEPRSVSLYCLSISNHIMLRIVREIKARNPDIITVLGGPQASATARNTMIAEEDADYLCSGEGEDTVVPFFRSILENDGDLSTIPGVYYRKDGEIRFHNLPHPLCDLNTLPYWDDRLLEENDKTNTGGPTYFMPIDAGRGCPYSCTFCCTSNLWRRVYRLKSPERIVADIRYYKEKFGINSFVFSHDAFVANKRLVERVCDHLLETGLDITWKCSARVDCLTEELILKMKKAGMTFIEIGIETGSPRMQKLINKNLDLDRARRMIEFMLENDIRVMVFFMHGFPEETEEDLNATLELALSLLDMGVRFESMSLCRFSPATALTEKYFDHLVYDPSMKELARDIFGYQDELEMILQNKAIYPFYYNLDTPLRKEYQFMHQFLQLYQQFPQAIKRLRKLYKGDNLRFYRDFYNSNRNCFDLDINALDAYIENNSLEMILNTADMLDTPGIEQLKSVLTYLHHIRIVVNSKEDTVMEETYHFNYVDMNLNRSIEQWSKGETTIRLQKINGEFSSEVVNIQWG